ncbi:DUF4864 domain-containing protein [Limnobacter sp.]|uniref:DUF4864 domain-containing protein n=1 Tax=Limnobacter sp. TaxID=2003368 RepID=UPI003513838F
MPSSSNDRPAEPPSSKRYLERERAFQQKIWKLWILIFTIGLAAAFTKSALANPEQDQRDTRAVIEAQLAAFKANDGKKAFSYATPNIQTMFGDAATFMNMVREGYDVVYRPDAVRFVRFESDGANALHVLQMTDRHKTLWNVYYVLEKRAEGGWKISSCETEKAATQLI